MFASCCRGSNCSFARSMDGRISAAAPLALADQLPLPMIVKRGWLGFRPCKTRYIRITGFSFSFSTTLSK